MTSLCRFGARPGRLIAWSGGSGKHSLPMALGLREGIIAKVFSPDDATRSVLLCLTRRRRDNEILSSGAGRALRVWRNTGYNGRDV